MTTFFKKNGHNCMSMLSDSFASALEIGTGEDLMTTDRTSATGIDLRLRVGVVVVLDAAPELEKSLNEMKRSEVGLGRNMKRTYIHMLSAIPGSLSRRQRRLISSWESLSIWSRLMGVRLRSSCPGLVGDLERERARIRSYNACLREVVGVWGTVSASEPCWWAGVEKTDEGGEEELGVAGV
jgi:hypothetical protein